MYTVLDAAELPVPVGGKEEDVANVIIHSPRRRQRYHFMTWHYVVDVHHRLDASVGRRTESASPSTVRSSYWLVAEILARAACR